MISVNGVVIDEARLASEAQRHQEAVDPMESAAQELVLRELLAQRARALGVGTEGDEAVRAVLAAEVRTPSADEAACRRYYDMHGERFVVDAWVEVEHILFQLTPRIRAPMLRHRAGEILQALAQAGPAAFADMARQYSNCPSAAAGGGLGMVRRGETVPEFEAEVFAMPAHTLRDRLVETRDGFHIVRTGARDPGRTLAFEEAHARIAEWLQAASERRATHQYLQWLVGQADIKGLDMQGADSPLLQ